MWPLEEEGWMIKSSRLTLALIRQMEITELHDNLAQRLKEGEREGGKKRKRGEKNEIYFYLE